MGRPIDIDVAIKAVYDEWDDAMDIEMPGWAVAIEVEDVLCRIPSVEPKTGRWIKPHRDDCHHEVYAECDQCHGVFIYGWGNKFCRGCGAKML